MVSGEKMKEVTVVFDSEAIVAYVESREWLLKEVQTKEWLTLKVKGFGMANLSGDITLSFRTDGVRMLIENTSDGGDPEAKTNLTPEQQRALRMSGFGNYGGNA